MSDLLKYAIELVAVLLLALGIKGRLQGAFRQGRPTSWPLWPWALRCWVC